MECIAVDWSGALHGSAARIWIARAQHGQLTALFAPGSRAAVSHALHERRRDAAPCLVGLDFAFGFPAWFANARGWRTIDDVWDGAKADGERWLSECAPPFWGRAGARREHEAARGLRATEREWPLSPPPKSTLQIGGAGAVGTGTVRGMPMLRAWRTSGWSVWPFDPPGSHTLVEIYPRLFTGAVIKRRSSARLDYLSRIPDLAAEDRDAMVRSEDAFDAALSAIAMSRAVSANAEWPATHPEASIEGQIWIPGPERDRVDASRP